MRVRWTDPAARDLRQICDSIQEHDAPATARRVALAIYESVGLLVRFPHRGRPAPYVAGGGLAASKQRGNS